MNQLRKMLEDAGYRAVQKKKDSSFQQCTCGAILNKHGLCRNCDPPKLTTRLRRGKDHE